MAARAIKSTRLVDATLPQLKKIGAINAVFKDFDMSYFDQVHALYVASASEDASYSAHEVEKAALTKKLLDGKTFLVVDEKTDDLMSVVPQTDSPCCRSNNAMASTCFALTSPKYRGKGLIREAYLFSYLSTSQLGYFGLNARVPVTSRNIVPCFAVGGAITGTIPMSTFVDKIGYVDNVMFWKDYKLGEKDPEFYEALLKIRDQPLPVLITDDVLISKLCAWNEFPTIETKTKAGMVQIRSVKNLGEVVEAEKLWRASAERGQGFGLDEFDENGHFNRKFQASPDIMVAELASTGQIIGAMMMGPSRLARAKKNVLAHLYMAIDKDHENLGVGTSLLLHSLEILEAQGFHRVVSDTYLNNHKLIATLYKYNFLLTGSMPCCGFLKGHGPMTSAVFYKSFK